MSTLCAIGSIIALVFFVLSIAALPALRKAKKEGKRLYEAHKHLLQNCTLDVLNHEARIQKLETFHAEEIKHRPAVLIGRLASIENAVASGHMRPDDAAAIKRKIWTDLAECTPCRCVEIKPEGSQ
jgi:hypothetical protein